MSKEENTIEKKLFFFNDKSLFILSYIQSLILPIQ